MKFLVTKVQETWNPFEYSIWEDNPTVLTYVGIEKELKILTESVYDESWTHVKRIAWLVRYGWHEPIHIDVGVPGYCEFYMSDGNHRFAAAIFRGDKFIECEVAGDLEGVAHYSGLTIEQVEFLTNDT